MRGGRRSTIPWGRYQGPGGGLGGLASRFPVVRPRRHAPRKRAIDRGENERNENKRRDNNSKRPEPWGSHVIAARLDCEGESEEGLIRITLPRLRAATTNSAAAE